MIPHLPPPFFLALSLFFSPPLYAQESDSPNTWIGTLTGEVQVLHHGETNWTPAEAGVPLNPGDSIQTKENGSAEILYGENGILDLSSNSHLVIREPSSILLRAGILLGRIKALLAGNRRFEIRTPTAIAAVRGTEFGVQFSPERETSVGVFEEGELEVESLNDQGNPSGAKVTLHPDQETTAKLGMPPSSPHPLRLLIQHRARVKKFRNRIQFLLKRRTQIYNRKRQELREKLREGSRPGIRKRRIRPGPKKRH